MPPITRDLAARTSRPRDDRAQPPPAEAQVGTTQTGQATGFSRLDLRMLNVHLVRKRYTSPGLSTEEGKIGVCCTTR